MARQKLSSLKYKIFEQSDIGREVFMGNFSRWTTKGSMAVYHHKSNKTNGGHISKYYDALKELGYIDERKDIIPEKCTIEETKDKLGKKIKNRVWSFSERRNKCVRINMGPLFDYAGEKKKVFFSNRDKFVIEKIFDDHLRKLVINYMEENENAFYIDAILEAFWYEVFKTIKRRCTRAK